MADYLPAKFPADSITMTVAAGQTVVAGNLVHVLAAGTVEPTATSDGSWLGVAAQGGAAGDIIMVFTEGLLEIVTTGVTAGAVVVPAASGQVATIGAGVNYSAVVGLALTTSTTGNTSKILVR